MLDKPQRSPNELTIRERQVLSLVAQGLSNKWIGRELGISGRTMETHVRSLRKKIGADNRTHLAALAVGLGMVCFVEPKRISHD